MVIKAKVTAVHNKTLSDRIDDFGDSVAGKLTVLGIVVLLLGIGAVTARKCDRENPLILEEEYSVTVTDTEVIPHTNLKGWHWNTYRIEVSDGSETYSLYTKDIPVVQKDDTVTVSRERYQGSLLHTDYGIYYGDEVYFCQDQLYLIKDPDSGIATRFSMSWTRDSFYS